MLYKNCQYSEEKRSYLRNITKKKSLIKMIAVCTDNMDEEHPNRVPDYVEEEDDVVRKKSTRRKKHRNKGLQILEYTEIRSYNFK